MDNTKFRLAIERSTALSASARDIGDLPEERRVIALVHAAQGLIDNGGLVYFFESNFPAQPPYQVFIDAYRAIGADDAAEALARAVALFPFEEPHLKVGERQEFMRRYMDEESDEVDSPFEPSTKILCGNKAVWRQLEAFITTHARSLGI